MSYYDSVCSRYAIPTVHLPHDPQLDEIDYAESKLMDRISAFVEQPPPPSSHYTKTTIASVHSITVQSRRKSVTPDSLSEEGEDKTRYYVGTAFAFSYKYLFTAYHIIEEPSPKYEVAEIFVSDPLNPMKKLHELQFVGYVKDLDVAVLRCSDVHFFRLALRTTALQTFSSVYTTQRVEQPVVTLHKGRAYPSERAWEGKCDAPSADRCSGSPVLDSEGRVIGMLTGRRGEINAVFTTSEGLLHALLIIRGPMMTWRDWGIKAVMGQGGGRPTPGQSNRARRTDDTREYEGGEESRKGTIRHKKPYRASELKRLSKPSWEPSVTSVKRYRVA
ncbi:hypothetical protein K440DRAFT_643150 [Wilcoxina mikolae CBS 423.85]|nr:hypothetical protein K440DRAFT_643150 [Wilcoxina mikolae CBS 423.85]